MSTEIPPPSPSSPSDAEVTAEIARAVRAIGAAPELALACHVTPDGDALGSTLGFLHLARNAGHRAVASWPDPFEPAKHYRSIPGLDLAVASARFPTEPACMLTFDCGSLGRLNELGNAARWAREHSSLVVVDHHATNVRYGTINAIDPHAAATTVVVREIARLLNWELTRDAAWCLYVGLVTDTGRFQYSSMTPEVFLLAEELSSFDLPLARLSRELFDEHRFAYLKLAADALARAELDPSLCLVSTSVSIDDLDRHGVRYEEAEGLIDWVRTAAEAEVACVLKQAPDGIRVSLRSVSRVNVGAVATVLGGGGHRLASGFTMRGSIEETLAAVKAALANELRHPTPFIV